MLQKRESMSSALKKNQQTGRGLLHEGNRAEILEEWEEHSWTSSSLQAAMVRVERTKGAAVPQPHPHPRRRRHGQMG